MSTIDRVAQQVIAIAPHAAATTQARMVQQRLAGTEFTTARIAIARARGGSALDPGP